MKDHETRPSIVVQGKHSILGSDASHTRVLISP